MALLGLIEVPEGVMWGDYFYDSVRTLEYTAAESEDEWEVVGKPKIVIEEVVKQPKWCRNGNACEWKNCKFRHERCSHYDNWVRRGKKGHNCRCHQTDPESKKRHEDGGCMYDHRDLSKLKVFIETLPCSTETELWDNFYERGLEAHSADIYDISTMSNLDKALLIRSLSAAKVEFEDCGKRMFINLEKED